MSDANLNDVVEQLQETQEELESINDNVETRSILNPLYWIGVCTIATGIIFCLTFIGIPFGWPLIVAGKKMMYKTPPSL